MNTYHRKIQCFGASKAFLKILCIIRHVVDIRKLSLQGPNII